MDTGLGYTLKKTSSEQKMTKKQFFGTDGIRGRVGDYPIQPEAMVKLGWAAGTVFKPLSNKPRVVIGRDTRRSGYMIESALEAGLTAAGVDVYLLGTMPTPGVAYLTQAFKACAGIVISASHNPHYDNGIKFFSAEGTKLSDELELMIEAQLSAEFKMVEPENLGDVKRIKDAAGRYVEFCKATTPHFFNLSGIKMVLDCAHGATHHIAPAVMQELGADTIIIGNQPDGLNINQQIGSTSPEALQAAVIEHKADVGIAFDGDGDRLIMVDAAGCLVDGDEILYILAKESQKQGLLKQGGVVGTLMSNFALEQALARDNIPFVRTKVGDRYVMQTLKEKQWHIGGESSGHIIWLTSTTTGDGIVAALQVLAVMQKNQTSLRDCLKGMSKTPQVLINVRLTEKLTDANWEALKAPIAAAEAQLGNTGRVLLRASGTEPLLRVMVEGTDAQLIHQLAENLAQEVSQLSTSLHDNA